MEFQFKSVYSRKDLASILYATEYLRWAQKPKTKRLWQLSHKAAPFVTLAGTAMFLLFSFTVQDPVLMLLGILVLAVGIRIGQRPSPTGRATKQFWRAFSQKGMEMKFCFDENAMDFYCGKEHVRHKYDSLLCVLEERGNFFLCFEQGTISCVLKKSELTGGTPDEFRRFMEEKTGNPVEYFK